MEVVAAAKISYRQLDYWVRQGYVKLPPTGSGSQRSFSIDQQNFVVEMADLVRAGLLPDLAHRAVTAERAGRPVFIGDRQLLGVGAHLLLPVRETKSGAMSALCGCGRWVRITKRGHLGRHGDCIWAGRPVRGA